MPDHYWRSNLHCVTPASLASPAPNMLGQLYSGASIRVVPCDPFLQDRGKLLRLLLRIGWPVLRVHVWHHMLEHPDLVVLSSTRFPMTRPGVVRLVRARPRGPS